MTKSQAAPSKTSQPKVEKQQPALQADESSQTQLTELEKLIMGGSLLAQGDALGNPKILTSQRQQMARKIGQVQGNRHLNKVLRRSLQVQSSIIQRQPSGGGGPSPASPAQIQHAKAVDALKKSYDGSITQEGSIEEKSLDDFNNWYYEQKKGTINPDTGEEWKLEDITNRTERIFGVQVGAAHIVVPILPEQGGQNPNSDDNRISTIAHEILHANCKIKGSVPLLLEECATEYLATKAVQAAGYSPGIAKYSNAMDTFYELARQVGGLSVIQDAYLNSGAGQFQQTFDAAKGAGAWQFFVDSMNAGDNANAKSILMHGTRGTVFDKKMMVLSNIVDATWITDEELNQFQQGWGELLIEEKKICRPRFQLIIDHATVMRDSRKTTLESTMAS